MSGAGGARRAGRLILVPAPLEQAPPTRPWLCEPDREQVARLTRFYVETPKAARAWLKALPVAAPLQSIELRALPPVGPASGRATSSASAASRASGASSASAASGASGAPIASGASGGSRGSPATASDWRDWLAPLLAGESVGLMSDAGCPGVADPGAALVAAAHDAGIEVHPLIGPSSLLLGLMASGLNGQRFTFQGYLPVDRQERRRAIERLGQRSAAERETVLLIETPYRNQATAEALVEALPATARLCIAVDLAGPAQSVATRRISAWRSAPPVLPRKLPAVFLFLC